MPVENARTDSVMRLTLTERGVRQYRVWWHEREWCAIGSLDPARLRIQEFALVQFGCLSLSVIE